MADIKAEMEKIRKEGQERVAATGQTICIFADNVPASIAEDILAGMRLMTELTNKKFDKETQQREWYNYYNDGLIKFGWTMTGAAHAEDAIDEDNLTLAELITHSITISVARDPRRAACAKRVMQVIVEKPQVREHLEKHSHSESGKSSNFVVAQCEMTPQGLPVMHMTSFQASYDSKIERDGALTRKIDKTSTRVYRASQNGSFSVRHFDAARDLVNEKIKGDIAAFLAI
ncbi:TPA: hypothetical protein U8203_004758 [Pseudomonas putida]|jgi:hypothetical protein|uniref:Uncharacterized protein n=1 Tax=Pseudomonas putida (strain W619) TaxID=390235 RepID=B1JEB6_PSEPW|nr:hypothetical protein [Pseudomonas putida]QQE83816.1 hypothetical protein JET17_24990 [Pseudomonas putida]UTL80968.1 hypothetical protein NL778_23875 [Pseudomonas putida]HEN8714572.1 hypothetical protein [Pseudomonas putida]HEN8719390.1 hypothetical protein [Pseudomonas putida]